MPIIVERRIDDLTHLRSRDVVRRAEVTIRVTPDRVVRPHRFYIAIEAIVHGPSTYVWEAVVARTGWGATGRARLIGSRSY